MPRSPAATTRLAPLASQPLAVPDAGAQPDAKLAASPSARWRAPSAPQSKSAPDGASPRAAASGVAAPSAAASRLADWPPLLDAPPAGEAPDICCDDAGDVSKDGLERDACAAGLRPEKQPEAMSARALRARQQVLALGTTAPGLLADASVLQARGLPARGVLAREADPTCWNLGAAPVDCYLGPDGLADDGVHEIKPMPGMHAQSRHGGHATDWSAALAFLLLLARRRLAATERAGRRAAFLWCAPRHVGRELGELYAPGLACLGIDPEQVMLVETRRRDETLWAIEEGLAAGALSLVAGVVDDLALTPARRLALRASRHRTPCLLLTSPRSPAAAATASRWSVSRAKSAPHPFDPRAPGAVRLAVTLERCRSHPLVAERQSFTLEWSDETHRFHMARGLADRAADPRDAGRRIA